MRDSQVSSWNCPATKKESAVSCLFVQCVRTRCDVGLMLVLGRGVWVKEIKSECLDMCTTDNQHGNGECVKKCATDKPP